MQRDRIYPDGRDWSQVKAKIMFKGWNEIIAMDVVKRIEHWPKTGLKGMPNLDKLLCWIVAVYDPLSPLQHEFRGDMEAKKREAATLTNFEKRKGVWVPEIYNGLFESKMVLKEEDEDEEDDYNDTSDEKLKKKKSSSKAIMNRIMKMIVGYIIWCSGRKWQALCSYENFYVELIYLINKPLASEKSKDLMDALEKKNKMRAAIRDTDVQITEAWDDLLQEDEDLIDEFKREVPVKPENQ